jgi:hypothetical protein
MATISNSQVYKHVFTPESNASQNIFTTLEIPENQDTLRDGNGEAYPGLLYAVTKSLIAIRNLCWTQWSIIIILTFLVFLNKGLLYFMFSVALQIT